MYTISRESEHTSDRIEDLLNEFDFHSVRRVMLLLDWRWAGIDRIPTVDDMRKRARYLLRDVSESKYQRHATGGFVAERDDDGALSLYFYVDHVEEYFGE